LGREWGLRSITPPYSLSKIKILIIFKSYYLLIFRYMYSCYCKINFQWLLVCCNNFINVLLVIIQYSLIFIIDQILKKMYTLVTYLYWVANYKHLYIIIYFLTYCWLPFYFNNIHMSFGLRNTEHCCSIIFLCFLLKMDISHCKKVTFYSATSTLYKCNTCSCGIHVSSQVTNNMCIFVSHCILILIL